MNDILRLAIVAIVGATVVSAADITIGIDMIDRLIDLLDVQNYI